MKDFLQFFISNPSTLESVQKEWSQNEIVNYTQDVYNILREQGKTGLQFY